MPVVYLITETFKLAMAVMVSKRFPFKILGTIVNKKSSYELMRRVEFREKLKHR